MSRILQQQHFELFLTLALVTVSGIVCPAPHSWAQTNNVGNSKMRIQIIGGAFPNSDGCIISLRTGGRLFDADGHPIQVNKLKGSLSDPGLLNKSHELVINLAVGDRKMSLEQLTAALQIIQDSIPEGRRTLVYLLLPLRNKKNQNNEQP